MTEYVIHTDGGSRGNPGPAAFAYTIERPGEIAIEDAGFLGTSTNNIAEYTGLVRALERAKKLGARRLLVYSDSELMIHQMNGVYKVKHPGLVPLYREADALRREFDNVTLRHVRREQNTRADELCNEALDAASGRSAPLKSDTPRPPGAAPRPDEDPNRRDLERLVRDDVLTCLRAGAASWASDKESKLQAEHVWDQIWSILIDAGVIKKRKR